MRTLKKPLSDLYIGQCFVHANQMHAMFRASQMACLLSNYNKRLRGRSWRTGTMTMKVFAGAVQPFWRKKKSEMSYTWVQTHTRPFHMAHASYT